MEDNTPTWKIFASIIGVIIAGTAGWILLTVMSTRTTAPDSAKELAKEFEKVCYEKVEEVETCKQLTGQHHRHCLHEAEMESKKSNADEAPDYNEQKYLECMEKASDLNN